MDAALLACAGLDRLGFGDRIAERLDPETMLPAIGQGALALEARGGDDRVRGLAPAAVGRRRPRRPSPPSGRCWPPWAAAATPRWPATPSSQRRTACWCEPWWAAPTPARSCANEIEGAASEAAALGSELARRLLARGADRILADLG